MDYKTVRVPTPLYDRISDRATAERRNVSQMLRVLLEDALEIGVPAIDPEPWPGEKTHETPGIPLNRPAPTKAERDWATEDPVEDVPEITPELVEPMFVPAAAYVRSDEVTPHFKPTKKK